jgi:predicted ester cyclase
MTRLSLVLVLTLVRWPFGSIAQSGIANQPSAEEKLVLSYFHDVLDGGKVDLVEGMFQPDYVIHFASGDVKGGAGLHTMVERRVASFSSFATEVHDIFGSGDKVVVRLTHRGTGAASVRSRIGIHDVSGKSVTWDAIVIFRMKDGKIAEEWVNRDELGMLLSAGVLKAN